MEENKTYDAFENLFVGKPRFVNLAIVCINIIVFLMTVTFVNIDLSEAIFEKYAAYTPDIIEGEYYRLFTCMFLHFSITHIFGNMVMILFVGDELESIVGHLKYFVIAIISGLCGNIATLAFDCIRGEYPLSAGASGLAYGILGGMIACIIKNKEKKSVSLKKIIIVTVLMLITDFSTTNINAIAHLGGLISGLILGLILKYANENSVNNNG